MDWWKAVELVPGIANVDCESEALKAIEDRTGVNITSGETPEKWAERTVEDRKSLLTAILFMAIRDAEDA